MSKNEQDLIRQLHGKAVQLLDRLPNVEVVIDNIEDAVKRNRFNNIPLDKKMYYYEKLTNYHLACLEAVRKVLVYFPNVADSEELKLLNMYRNLDTGEKRKKFLEHVRGFKP